MQTGCLSGQRTELTRKRTSLPAPRKQKTDRNNARLLLELLEQDRFPRIGVSDQATRDLRRLLMHRHKLATMRRAVSKLPPAQAALERCRGPASAHDFRNQHKPNHLSPKNQPLKKRRFISLNSLNRTREIKKGRDIIPALSLFESRF
ncbi:hypothetical protein [Edaphobacter aggregans]|uniref:hypothetical protein n=1 Tax=Edaphobacter aggregans TaxID=570835 RepID=UPI0012F8FE5D|nr:hypothetical protein [Edaphobacter aggregans]